MYYLNITVYKDSVKSKHAWLSSFDKMLSCDQLILIGWRVCLDTMQAELYV
jgi:hypothetical protein